MAGIGFKLRSILQKGTYSSQFAAYAYGAIISTGPWLVSILSIGILNYLCRTVLLEQERILFRTVLVYTYMGTLVFTGPFYMATTRYLADKMFSGDYPAILPTFKYVSMLALFATTVFSGLFYFMAGLEVTSALAAVVLFQSVTLTWVAMIFLSAARDYFAVIKVFAAGYLLALFLGFGGAYYYRFDGLLWGFGAGMLVLGVLLCARVYQEFPSRVRLDRGVLGYWRGMPWLILCGFCYNAGLWVDKIIFWIADGRKAVGSLLYAPADYDTCFFWAYLTIVPAMTLFLIRIETSFYSRYADFLGAVVGGASYQEIEQKRQILGGNLRLSVSRLLKIQGGFTGILVFIAPDLVKVFQLSSALVIQLRYAFLAAFVQALFLIMIILILYFDLQRLAGLLTLLALFLNTVFSLYFAFYHNLFGGIGALAAFLIALLVGMYFFNRHMKDLIFETFARQQILS